MSYDIIKSIRIKDRKVFLLSASNNVYPRHFEEGECPTLTAILASLGKEAIDLEILSKYEKGNFQRGANKYTRALEVLRHMPEYALYDWRVDGNEERRGSEEFKELLRRALRTRLPKDKFTIVKKAGEGKVFIRMRGRQFATWTSDKTRAKVFRYAADAEGLKKCFTNNDGWAVEKIN